MSFWTDWQKNILDQLTAKQGASAGAFSYVQFTNGYLKTVFTSPVSPLSRAAQLGLALRNAEAVVVPMILGVRPFNQTSALIALAQVTIGVLGILFAPPGLTAALVSSALFAIGSTVGAALLQTILQDYPNIGTDVLNLIKQTYNDALNYLDNKLSQLDDLINKGEQKFQDFFNKYLSPTMLWSLLPGFHDPLVLNFQGHGPQLTSVSDSHVSFDFNGSGQSIPTGWISSNEGILLLDNGSGNISQEMLGAQSGNGFADLRALDSNGDGVIDANDAAFSSLKVWIDANSNGQVDPGEIVSLSDLGITSISLATNPDGSNINGNIVVAGSTFSTSGGSSGTISEVEFGTNTEHQRYVAPADFEYASQALLLPQLAGYGNLTDLQVAMTLDPSLLTSVQALVEDAGTMTGTEFDAAFQNVVLEWAGVSGVAQDAYGTNVNGRHLALIGALYGIDISTLGDPNALAGPKLETLYRSLIDQLEVRFVGQISESEVALGITPAASDPFSVLASILFDFSSDTISVTPDLLIQGVIQGAPTDQADQDAYYSLAFAGIRGLEATNFGGDSSEFAAGVLSELGASGVDQGLQQIALSSLGVSSIIDETANTGVLTIPSNGAVVFLGMGDKSLSGGSSNIYVYSTTSGNDSIADAGADAQLVLSGVASTDVVLGRPIATNDLIITNTATGSVVTLTNFFSTANFNVSFSDGQTVTATTAQGFMRSEAINYLLSPQALTDSASVRQSQLMFFGFSTEFNESSQNGTVSGSAGSDVLLIGTGNKTITGDGGADIYVYTSGGGNVVIDDLGNNGNLVSDLVMNGIASTDVSISRPNGGADLILTDNNTGATVTVSGEYTHGSLNAISFSDGVTWTFDLVQQMLLDQESATPGASIYGYADRADTLIANEGDRYLAGGGGADTYVYSAAGGNDVIDDSGNLFGDVSTLQFIDINSTDVTLSRPNGGNDLILTVNSTGKTVTVSSEFFFTGTGSLAAITFADGVSWTRPQIEQMLLEQESGAVGGTVYGYFGNDTLIAGLGDKTLVGEGGANIYVYTSAGGNDVIDDTGSLFGGVSTLQLSDIDSTDVILSRPGGGNNLVLTINSTGKTVTIDSEFFFTGTGSLASVAFADGVSWTLPQIEQMLLEQESAAVGGTVYGYSGNDTLIAGLGDKTLVGEGGANTYFYSSAGGNDVIDDTGSLFGGVSTLDMSDIDSTDVTLSRPNGGNDVVLTVNSTGKTVTIDSELFFTGTGSLASITFADGVSWTLSQVEQILLSDESAAIGGTVYGYSGNDTLVAGLGDKTLVGGGGANTYVYTSAGGNDVIDDTGSLFGGVSTLDLSDINSTDVTLSHPDGGNNLVLKVNSTGKTITIDSEFFFTGTGSLASITFADGVSWTLSQVEQMLLSDESAANGGAVYGFSGNDTLVAGPGDKILNGEDGADTFIYSSTGGNDVVVGENQGVLEFSDIASTGVSLSRANNGVDLAITVTSTGKTVTVQGEFQNDQSLTGVTFADGVTWSRSQIEDILNNGSGSIGQQGYLYNSGTGQVTLSASGSGAVNFLQMGPGISASDLFFQANSSGDLTIKFLDSASDAITIQRDLLDLNGIVSSAVSHIEFSDGTSMDLGQAINGQGAPLNFTWFGNTNNFDLSGSDFGTNTFDVTAHGNSLTFGNASQGGSGKNIINYAQGSGSLNVSLNGGSGVVDFGAGVTASEVDVQADNAGNLSITIAGDTTDSISVGSDLKDTAGVVTSGITTLQFSDGSSIDLTQDPLAFTWLGNTNSFNVTGSNFGANTFDVTAAGNIAFGNASDGGTGQNVINYTQGAGSLSVSLNGGTGVIKFGAGVTANNVDVQSDNFGNLTISIAGDTSDSIFVKSDLTVANGSVTSGITSLEFSDGSSIDLTHYPLAFTWLGGTSNFNVSGSNLGTNVFDVTAIGNISFGNASGGGTGQNVINYTEGAGALTVSLNGGVGVIDFGPGVTASDVDVQTNGGFSDLVVKIAGDSTDSIFIRNDLTNNSGVVTSGITALQFSDGTSISLAQNPTFTWLGNTSNFNITGSGYGPNLFDVTAAGNIGFGNTQNGGNGHNTINYTKGAGALTVSLNGGTGVIDFGAGVTASDVDVQTNGGFSDLVVTIAGDPTDSIFIRNDLTNNSGVVTSGITALQFSDGTSISLAQNPTFTWLGNTNNFNITGSGYGPNLFDVTAAGNIGFGNTQNGGNGHNTINYTEGAGALTVSLDGGTGVIDFGPGVTANDVDVQTNGGFSDLVVKIAGDATDSIFIRNDLTNNSGVVTSSITALQFSDGTSISLAQNPTFTWLGNTSNFNITGSGYGPNVFDVTAAGNIGFGNTQNGGNGHNTINYTKGAGALTVSLNGGTGVIDFGSGVTASDVDVQTNGGFSDLVVEIAGDPTDSIFIRNDLSSSNGVVTSGITVLQFSDGTSISLAQNPTFTWLGNTSNFNITGSNYGPNVFDVTAAGNISFGNTQNGGSGHNTINYTKGAGALTVSLNGGFGVIDFGSGVTASNVDMQSDSFGNLSIEIAGDTTDSIFVRNDLTNNSGVVTSGITALQFSDGSSINIGPNSPPQFTWVGAPNASISGSGFGANTFVLGAGSESVTGGGTGNGGDGNNTYVASTNTGQATIHANAAAGSTNDLNFVGAITDNNLWFQQSGNDLKIDLLGTTTQVDVSGWFSGGSNQLQEITAGGLKIDSQISQLVQAMATYSANHAGFDPTSSSNSAMPTDSSLQNSVAAAWHS
jgi:hypothetical protein